MTTGTAETKDASDLRLLEKTQALMEVERSLTATLEKVEPWLRHNTTLTPSSMHGFGKRVRPLPTTMEQVQQVLAVARNYSSRTSAPAGWNPAAPVMGFATPNPLPHQLRGGALAALQLERARQEERSQKRKRREEEEEQAKAKKLAEESKTKAATSQEEGTTAPSSSNQATDPAQNRPAMAGNPNPPPLRRASRPQPQVIQTTMNLSDSSSEEDSDDE